MKHINVLCKAIEADAKNSIGYIAQVRGLLGEVFVVWFSMCLVA